MFSDSDVLYYWAPILLNWGVSSVALWLTASIVPGFRLKKFTSAMLAAVLVSIANAWLRPLFLFLTLPINILTLGLFTFVINGVILKICAAVLRDFKIDSWSSAILGAFVLSVLGTLLHYLLG